MSGCYLASLEGRRRRLRRHRAHHLSASFIWMGGWSLNTQLGASIMHHILRLLDSISGLCFDGSVLMHLQRKCIKLKIASKCLKQKNGFDIDCDFGNDCISHQSLCSTLLIMNLEGPNAWPHQTSRAILRILFWQAVLTARNSDGFKSLK